jgi:hypothetical protein
MAPRMERGQQGKTESERHREAYREPRAETWAGRTADEP